MSAHKPILCLDFDGVIHSYTSGWRGASTVSDGPTPGAMAFIRDAVSHFSVSIYSSRSAQNGGIGAMQGWMISAMIRHLQTMTPMPTLEQAQKQTRQIMALIDWPTSKPAAFLTIDDRALTFTGVWPTVETLLAFKPWNKL